MELHRFQLHFTSPLHISNIKADYGKSEQMFHSDSLVAAVMQAWAVLGKSEWITKNHGFVTTSLFPFTSIDSRPVYFFPKPYLRFNSQNEIEDTDKAKKEKKVQYIDQYFFLKAIKQEHIETNISQYKGSFLTVHAIDGNFITNKLRIRIRKPRNDHEDAEPFYMEEIRFKKKSGLWGMAYFDDEVAKERFNIAMNYLQDAGIGTDRNVGNGQFEFKWDESSKFNINDHAGDYGVNLSLFCPENHDQLESMLNPNARYEVIKRGGWISEPFNTYRKRSVWMFKEGSILRIPQNTNVLGGVVNVKPAIIQGDRAVWRSGKAIFLPVNWNGEQDNE